MSTIKVRTLMYKGKFVDEMSLYNRELSTQAVPDSIYSENYTLEDRYNNAKQVMEIIGQARDRDLDHLNNLQMCKMALIEIKVIKE